MNQCAVIVYDSASVMYGLAGLAGMVALVAAQIILSRWR